MNTALCILLLAALVHCACAQTFAPELAPHAVKYKTDLATLELQRAAAVTQAQKPYVEALAGAEKTATARGDVAGAAAIAGERSALTRGLMPPGFPPGLPKELQAPRRIYLDAVERIRTAETPRRQALDGVYLRALTNLGARAPKESEIARQIEAEKEKLMANTPSTSGKTSSKNALVNGTFDTVEDGRPAGWTAKEGFKVARDGTNNVLHASSKMPNYNTISQDILLPPKARSVTISGRIRGTIVTRDVARSPGAPPGVLVQGNFLDKSEQPSNHYVPLNGGSDGKWKAGTVTSAVPDDMKILRVSLVLRMVTGEFDFDDIVVEFR